MLGFVPTSSALRKWSLISLALLLVCIALGITVIVLATESARSYRDQCNPEHEISSEIEEDSLFHDLTLDEIAAVKDFVMSDNTLRLKEMGQAASNDNFIFGIEHYLPRKGEVEKYWEDRHRNKPVRMARVIVFFGAEEIPHITEYLVYPMPKPTTKSELLLHGRQHPIPYYRRPFSRLDFEGMDRLVRQVSEKAYGILMESFGYAHHNCSAAETCLTLIVMGMPGSLKNGSRQSWVSTLVRLEGIFLYPLPFLVLVDHLDADVTKWKVIKVTCTLCMFIAAYIFDDRLYWVCYSLCFNIHFLTSKQLLCLDSRNSNYLSYKLLTSLVASAESRIKNLVTIFSQFIHNFPIVRQHTRKYSKAEYANVLIERRALQ